MRGEIQITSTQNLIRAEQSRAHKRIQELNRQIQFRCTMNNWLATLCLPFQKASGTIFRSHPGADIAPTILLSVKLWPSQQFRDLAPLLEFFMENGWEPLRCNDYPESLNRDYLFRHPDKSRPLVTVAAYADEASPTCRKIPIGTRTVTETEYEIICED